MATSPIDRHLARFPDSQREALEKVRDVLRTALPGAEETISYNMPTFAVDGISVIGFDGFKDHNSLFPYGTTIVVELADELSGYASSKGTIRFPKDSPFPAPLLKRIVRRRIELINETFPTKGGETREFYSNGRLKLRGRVRAGQMDGYWEWFRRDGSPLRSGTFTQGVQTGPWTTYDRSGAAVRTTEMG